MKKERYFAKIKDLIKAIYKDNSAGGALHIVLDDLNCEEDCIVWCIVNPINDIEDKGLRRIYLKCAAMLLTLTYDERIKVISEVSE